MLGSLMFMTQLGTLDLTTTSNSGSRWKKFHITQNMTIAFLYRLKLKQQGLEEHLLWRLFSKNKLLNQPQFKRLQSLPPDLQTLKQSQQPPQDLLLLLQPDNNRGSELGPELLSLNSSPSLPLSHNSSSHHSLPLNSQLLLQSTVILTLLVWGSSSRFRLQNSTTRTTLLKMPMPSPLHFTQPTPREAPIVMLPFTKLQHKPTQVTWFSVVWNETRRWMICAE